MDSLFIKYLMEESVTFDPTAGEIVIDHAKIRHSEDGAGLRDRSPLQASRGLSAALCH